MNPESRNSIFLQKLGSELAFYASLSFLYVDDYSKNTRWLVSKEHLLQLSDTANQRYTTLFTSIVADIYDDESVPNPGLLGQVFNWEDAIVEKFENVAYASIKMWQTIMTTYLLMNENVDQNKFPAFIKREFFTSQGKTDIGRLIQKWNQLETTLKGLSSHKP